MEIPVTTGALQQRTGKRKRVTNAPPNARKTSIQGLFMLVCQFFGSLKVWTEI